jgi:transposase-like protein
MKGVIYIMAITMERKKGGRPASLRKPRSTEEIREFVELYKMHTATELAGHYDVNPSTIRSWACDIRKGRY